MPATPRPRGFSGASTSSGRSNQNTPMSERQQMALLMQMTSSNQSDACGHGPARSRDRNERGETALHVAAIKGDQDSVKKLIDQGINPNVIDFAGWSPLHEACNHGHYNVALLLVKAGANINAKGLEDNTPLHDAAIVGHLKLVKMLVEKGADPTAKNRKGKTPCDVAAASVYNFLQQIKDTAGANRTSQVKKTAETKGKSGLDENEENTQSGTGNANTNLSNSNITKEEDDVYEFKATPKDQSLVDDKLENSNTNNSSNVTNCSSSGKTLDKTTDEKLSTDENSSSNNIANTNSSINVTNQTKRAHSDVEPGDDSTFNISEDETKRKKRKDGEIGGKESNKSASNSRVPLRQEKGSKVLGAASKIIGLQSKSGQIDRKSPCASPKPIGKATDSDAETETDVKSENIVSSSPKVPPLKIVIPQQNTTGDQETGSRNGKNTSARNHPALPYVVASSNSGNESNTDKESSSSRCASPTEPSKPSDGEKLQLKSGTTSSAEERAQQRVLRSSHRSGGSTGQAVDRGSNNSSPQLQSSSPSPAPPTAGATNNTNNPSTCTNVTESSVTISSAQSTSSNTNSPAQPQNPPTEPEPTVNASSPSAVTSTTTPHTTTTVELHPRKRKIRASKEENKTSSNSSTTSQSTNESEKETVPKDEVHTQDQPMTNCYQMYLNIRKQIESRQRNLIPVQPKPPQGFKDYLMNRCTYVLSGKTSTEPTINFPNGIPTQMKEIFQTQEKERHKLKMQHVVEKEKLVLAVEQEILRVHGRAARTLANQSLPFSVCTILKDEEVYNMISPDQEEKDRNARSRYNGRLFLSWLQDVDDKWEKIKEAMLFRHHNEVESLHAVQKMDWEWKMKELLLCEFKAKPVIEEQYVPIVHVSDDFDLLPA